MKKRVVIIADWWEKWSPI